MSARVSRRQILAAIALADLPMPSTISIGDSSLSLHFNHLADLPGWAQLMGMSAEAAEQALAGARTYTDSQGQTRRTASMYPTWMGQVVQLIASEPIDASPVEQLDEATREQLAAVAAMASSATYEREDPVANEPLPVGVEGRSLGGRRGGEAL